MSKTEAMYFPPPKSAYDQADTTQLNIDGGHVHFTKQFKYLGSILSSNLKDDDEIDSCLPLSLLFANSSLDHCKYAQLMSFLLMKGSFSAFFFTVVRPSVSQVSPWAEFAGFTTVVFVYAWS